MFTPVDVLNVPVLALKSLLAEPEAVKPVPITGLVSVLFVSVLVLPSVGTLAAFVPAVVMRSSPVPIVRMPLLCVSTTLLLSKLIVLAVSRCR